MKQATSLYFFKSIVDCLNNIGISGRISFEQVFTRFTEISWNIIVKYNVRQKAVTLDHKRMCIRNKFYSIIQRHVLKINLFSGAKYGKRTVQRYVRKLKWPVRNML